jgi:hypothetical protein
MRILITVKTYPQLSTKYEETVCTAGINENGDWIRLYPIPYRKLDHEKRYDKYRWIEADVQKNTKDFRPESYRPLDYDSIQLLEKIETKNDSAWLNRRKWIEKTNIHDNLVTLIEECYSERKTSLATFKPAEIIDFTYEADDKQWDQNKVFNIENQLKLPLFDVPAENPFKVVEKIPYKFRYKFKDSQGKISNLSIEDWEIFELFRNCRDRHKGDEQKALEDVRKKYFDDFVKTKDLSLFLGTTEQWQRRKATNPFMIIGVFYPKAKPASEQLSLFDSF